MIKLGVNSVLFKTMSFAEAARCIKKAGYDGVGICGISGMCTHFNPLGWKVDKGPIRGAIEETGLEILSSEIASHDPEIIKGACEGAAEIGIPVLCIGPSGQMNDEDSLKACFDSINRLCEFAEQHGVTLCCKAHVGSSVWNTPTSLQLASAIKSPNFGIDMDPSHIHRAGEVPSQAVAAVIDYVKHVHIRDCKGPGPSPGESGMQACGRGDIDLYAYLKALVDANYNGACCLEVIGPELDAVSASIIAAESYGYMNACLKMLGAR
ncbi:MAG: sugar phosphate isomerase/epimerase [Clostridiales bacterium]|nr:sugar phosphate isomerase/epimerase [Clostridiales bacterium]